MSTHTSKFHLEDSALPSKCGRVTANLARLPKRPDRAKQMVGRYAKPFFAVDDPSVRIAKRDICAPCLAKAGIKPPRERGQK